MDLNVDSVLDDVIPVEESSMSMMQLPEKHDEKWYGGESKELWRMMSMMSEDDIDRVD